MDQSIELVLLVVIVGGCIVYLIRKMRTYTIELESFMKQFGNIPLEAYTEKRMQGPSGKIITYKTIPVDVIKCIAKNGEETELRLSPALEIRFTDTANKRTVFYFDQICVSATEVSGYRSRLLGMPKSIPLNTIIKIEIQNGAKNFKYV